MKKKCKTKSTWTYLSRFVLILFGVLSISHASAAREIHYELHVPLDNRENFKVTLTIPAGILGDDGVYHFVAYAPGVHQKMDFGRLVTRFEAYDNGGNRLAAERLGTNDWRIEHPGELHKIVYEIGDTFDLPAGETLVHPQAGSGIGSDYALINPHALFGYFEELSDVPVRLEITYPKKWKMGTAMRQDENGSLLADSYRDLLDAPILIGELSTARMAVGEIDVEVFAYSPNDAIDASHVLEISKPVLESAVEFIGFAPVSRYVLLVYCFSDENAKEMPSLNYWGALEHGNSSTYALPAKAEMLPYLKDMIAHEFLHILSPLNLHSQQFNTTDYSKPVNQDDHLWLYEGVTEWATHIMKLRSGEVSLETYLEILSAMIRRSRTFAPPYSLLQLSNEWETDEGREQYRNIYQLGALTASILDIRLLRLSEGQQGLLEVYLDLVKKYGKDKAFDNDAFFDEFIAATHPEIRSFFERHIFDYTPFDFAEEFAPLGISYFPVVITDNSKPFLGFAVGSRNNALTVEKVLSPDISRVKVKVGDSILSGQLDGQDIAEAEAFLNQISDADVGSRYKLWVRREGEKIELQGTVLPEAKYDVFREMKDATFDQKTLREKWSYATPNCAFAPAICFSSWVSTAKNP